MDFAAVGREVGSLVAVVEHIQLNTVVDILVEEEQGRLRRKEFNLLILL